MQGEGEYPDRAGEEQADDHALEHHRRPVDLAQVLQEDHDLEALAVDRGEAQQAEARLREAQARHAPLAEQRPLAIELDSALTAVMRAAFAAQRAAIGPRGYEDRIYRRKAMARPDVHALTAEAERLLTLRENHRLNGIPPVPLQPAV